MIPAGTGLIILVLALFMDFSDAGNIAFIYFVVFLPGLYFYLLKKLSIEFSGDESFSAEESEGLRDLEEKFAEGARQISTLNDEFARALKQVHQVKELCKAGQDRKTLSMLQSRFRECDKLMSDLAKFDREKFKLVARAEVIRAKAELSESERGEFRILTEKIESHQKLLVAPVDLFRENEKSILAMKDSNRAKKTGKPKSPHRHRI